MRMEGVNRFFWRRRGALRRACLLLVTVALLVPGLFAAEPLRIAAAADLEPVLPAVLDAFTKETGIAAVATYQSSATLATQIENGAGFDVFLAADLSFPQRLVAAGLTEQAQPVVYARGTLVLWARKDAQVLHGKALSLATLRDPALRTVAIANPDHAPYGRAARAALTGLGLLPALAPRLVTAENIAQAAQFASTGNAELGLISLTSALTPQMQAEGSFMEIPRAVYPPILQGAVALKQSPALDSAHRLLAFLATPATRAALARRGLASPE